MANSSSADSSGRRVDRETPRHQPCCNEWNHVTGRVRASRDRSSPALRMAKMRLNENRWTGGLPQPSRQCERFPPEDVLGDQLPSDRIGAVRLDQFPGDVWFVG